MVQKLTILISLIILFVCNNNDNISNQSKPIKRDLQEIRKDSVLKVLLTYSSTSYFVYRGRPMGFEYELLKRLAKELELELDIVLVNNIDSMIVDLNAGKADMIAHGLTITSDRKEQVAFTDYLYLTSQVLVQKKPDNWRQIG